MAANNRTLTWRIPWEPGRLQSMVSQRVRHNWATSLFFSLLINSSKEFGCEGGAVIWVEADGKCETRKSFYFYFSEGKINTLMLLCKLFLLFLLYIFPHVQSVHFSYLVMSDTWWLHGLQHAKHPVHHQIPEFTQTHVHGVGDAIQPSQPQSSPSPPAFNLSKHQGLFQWVSSSQQEAKSIAVSASASVLSMNIQDWFSLWWTGWIFLQSKGLSRVFSNTTVQKYQFFSAQLSL